MNQKLIKLTDTHYIVVDDSEIKEGDWCLSKLNEIIRFGKNYNQNLYKIIIATTEPIDGDEVGACFIKVKQLNLSEVEEVIYGYSVEKMSENLWLEPTSQLTSKKSFIQGFKAHQELVKDKLFTVDQVNNLVNSVTEFISHHEPCEFEEWYQKKLQKLLPKTEWDIEFVDGKIKLI